MQRQDDYHERRAHIASLTDEQLKDRFWSLAMEVVAPLVELARTHTSPSIERSVLLRMGFSSMEAAAIVDGCQSRGLLSKGAGNVVWRLSQVTGMQIREAGLGLASGRLWDDVAALFPFGNEGVMMHERRAEARRGADTYRA